MGVRLYPNTTDRAALEKLANVPAGTMDRLDAMNKRHAEERAASTNWSEYDDGYRQWQEINDDAALGAMEAFLLYGWGKFHHVPGLSASYAGSLDNPAQARMLLQSNGIHADAELAEGVHWS